MDELMGSDTRLLQLGRVLQWLRANFFSSFGNTIMTLALVGAVLIAAEHFLRWAVFTAVFNSTPESCQAHSGACWSMIADTWQLFLVGLYPAEERWRVVVAVAVGLSAGLAPLFLSARHWRLRLAIWLGGTIMVFILLHGATSLGLKDVESDSWGGLMLTVILAVVGQAVAFPLGIVLALARRSRHLPFVRIVATIYIEVMRSLPLVLVLLLATLVLPLFLPPTIHLDLFVTAQTGIILFSAAAIAEVVRGGLQGLPAGQEEAATALGLGYWRSMRLIVLPQAIRTVQPILVSTLITFVKGASLVVAIGLYDLLGAAVLASANPKWVGRTAEPLVLVAAVYWALCFSISRFSVRLERRRGRSATAGSGGYIRLAGDTSW